MDNYEYILETVHLSKRFGNLEVLKDINLEVKKGEVICIIGPSGAGKSTYLRSLNQLEKITSGKIYIHGDFTGKMIKLLRGLIKKHSKNCCLRWGCAFRSSTCFLI